MAIPIILNTTVLSHIDLLKLFIVVYKLVLLMLCCW